MNYQLGSFVDSQFLSHRNDDLVSPQPALPRWTGLEQGCVDAEISGIFQDTTVYAGVDSDTSLGWSSAFSFDIDFDPSPYPSLNHASSLDVDFNLSSCPSLDDTTHSDFGSGLDFDIVYGRYQPCMVPASRQSQVESLASHWDFTFNPVPPQLLHGSNRHTPTSADNDGSSLSEGHQTSTPVGPLSPEITFSHMFSQSTKAVSSTSPTPALDALFRYPCPHPGCTKSFKRKEHSTRHYKSQHLDTAEYLVCEFCGKDTFNRKDNLNAHRKLHARRRKRTTGVHFVPEAAVALKHDRQKMRGSIQIGTRQRWTATSAGW